MTIFLKMMVIVCASDGYLFLNDKHRFTYYWISFIKTMFIMIYR